MARRPPRPATIDDLEFRPQQPVVWFSLRELARTLRHLAISTTLGIYSDKRELLGAMPSSGVLDLSDRDEIWFDYVADLGDGFDATYSIASLITADVDLADPDGVTHATRQGRLLVMGGDEVYPYAAIENYEHRTIGPYTAALPSRRGAARDLVAIPGNHDWYDGLTAWLRMFAQGKNIGGWRTHQTRSYFAVRLPHGWWLWGIDVQFDSYIDAPQLEYFSDVAGQVAPGEQIVLCCATPEWVDAHRNDPESYRNLDYFERKIIAPTGAHTRIAMAGNAHHYARYHAPDRDLHRITSGGGGAYLSATHDLPDAITLPPAASTDPRKSEPVVDLHRVAAFPDVATSRRLGHGVWRFAAHNRGFAALLGVLYVVYAWTAAAIMRDATAPPASAQALADAWNAYAVAIGDMGFAEALLGLVGRAPALTVSLALFAGLLVLSKRRGWRRWLVGTTHALVHAAAIVVCVRLAFVTVAPLDTAVRPLAGAVVVYVLGVVVGPLVLAGYLSFGDRFGRNVNEQFSSMRIEDHKNFVRCHVGDDGALTLYPIGLERIARAWTTAPDDADDQPLLRPAEPLEPHLIERPIRLESTGP